MSEPTTFVGIDAHQRDLQIAMVVGAQEAIVQWTSDTDERAIARLHRKLEREASGPIECCYEAGPTGYVLQRRLTHGRVRCRVIAPALIPRKPGDRIKTNRRDARQLAHLLRAGLLTEVQVPAPADEAVRDLVRARDDVRVDLMRCRQRLGKLLLRRGCMYPGRNWTKRHREWLHTLTWSYPAERYVIADYQLAIAQLDARLLALDQELATVASQPPYAAAVAALCCFRGLDTTSAMILLAELYDVRRFPQARALMKFVGLVPREDSTGARQRRGAITKTGNSAVRRVLVQAAWHYRHDPRLAAPLRRRRHGQPPAVLAIAEKAEHRLCRRYRQLSLRLKPKPVIVTALARELVGFVWATLQLPEARMR